MPVVFSNVSKISCLEKEPYLSFIKKLKGLKGELNSSEIELIIGNGKEGFCKGFYHDENYMVNPRLFIVK